MLEKVLKQVSCNTANEVMVFSEPFNRYQCSSYKQFTDWRRRKVGYERFLLLEM